jgi:general stress protein YciG
MTDDHHETTPRRKRGPKPGSAGAKRGGQTLVRTRGPEFFATIGRKGGTAMRETYGSAFYTEIGKKGGDATRKRHDADSYRENGRKGSESGCGAPKWHGSSDQHLTTRNALDRANRAHPQRFLLPIIVRLIRFPCHIRHR